MTPACHHCHLPPPIPPGLQTVCLITQTDPAGRCSAAVTSRVGWVNYLKGFLCSFCCPNATPAEDSVHAGPVSVWLPLPGDRSGCSSAPGMELAHRGGSGWAEPNQWGQVGLGSHRASPAHLATSGGSQCCTMGRSRCHPGRNKRGLGFVHSQVEVLLLGTPPCSCSDPAGRRRVWGHLRVCNGCLFILTSSSSPLGWRLNGHSNGASCTRFRICFLTDDFSCCSLEAGLQ